MEWVHEAHATAQTSHTFVYYVCCPQSLLFLLYLPIAIPTMTRPILATAYCQVAL